MILRVGICRKCNQVHCNESKLTKEIRPMPRSGECLCGGQVVVTALDIASRFSLDRFQREQQVWAQKNFGKQPYHRQVMGVVEEVGELCHAFLKMEQGIRGDRQEHVEEAQDSIGDLMVFLAGVCNDQHWSLSSLIEITWNKVKQRDWEKDPKRGGEG